MAKIKRGGITYGRSHAKGGIPVKNQSTGEMLEVEGGEGIVNKRSMSSDKTVSVNGKKMTICEAVSQLNQMEGGVQFSCDDVEHKQFIEEMALGGELERGKRTEKEHIETLRKLYEKRITPSQATTRVAKEHLKEDPKYYSKLAKMEAKMNDGGMADNLDLYVNYQSSIGDEWSKVTNMNTLKSLEKNGFIELNPNTGQTKTITKTEIVPRSKPSYEETGIWNRTYYTRVKLRFDDIKSAKSPQFTFKGTEYFVGYKKGSNFLKFYILKKGKDWDKYNSQGKMGDGGEIIPQQGTLFTKDKKNKLEYQKRGNDYAFKVYEIESNPVQNYTRNQYKKTSNGEALMNYNQFINYLYAELYIDDNKMGDGGHNETKNLSEMFDKETENTLSEIHKKFAKGGEVTPTDSEAKLDMKDYEGYADEYNSRKNDFFKSTEKYQAIVNEGLEVKKSTTLSKEEKDKLLDELRKTAKMAKNDLNEERQDFVNMRQVSSPFYAPQLAKGGRIKNSVAVLLDKGFDGSYSFNIARNEDFPNIPIKATQINVIIQEHKPSVTFSLGSRNLWSKLFYYDAKIKNIILALGVNSEDVVKIKGYQREKSEVFQIDFNSTFNADGYYHVIGNLLEAMCNKEYYDKLIQKKEELPKESETIPTESDPKRSLHSIQIIYAEGAEDIKGFYYQWLDFQKALLKATTPREGVNKVKVLIRWNNGAYLEDRIDLGLSVGDFDPQRGYIGDYLKKQKSAAYGSSFEKGNDEKSRKSVDWGQAIESDIEEETNNYVHSWSEQKVADFTQYSVNQTESMTCQNVIARIVRNENGGSIDDLKQIENIAQKYLQLREYVYINDIMDTSAPEYNEMIERAYTKGFVELVTKTIEYVTKFYSDGGEPSIIGQEIYIAMPVLAQLDTFDTKYIKNLNNK